LLLVLLLYGSKLACLLSLQRTQNKRKQKKTTFDQRLKKHEMSSLMGSIFKGAAATAPATTAASTLSILRMGSPALRLASRPWSKDDIVSGTTRGLVRDMTATMHSSEGVGLAAPQVGINKQLVIVHLPADSDLPNLQRTL
jgi:peptide deformylase